MKEGTSTSSSRSSWAGRGRESLRTVAAKSVPGFAEFERLWGERAPLGWNVDNPEPAARACLALLSDWFPATSGEIVRVDGGAHAVGG